MAASKTKAAREAKQQTREQRTAAAEQVPKQRAQPREFKTQEGAPVIARPVRHKTGVVYYIFLAVLAASFFFPEIFLPGMAIICLVSGFDSFRIMRRYKTHGIRIFFQSSPEELSEHERHEASSEYRSRYSTSLEESKWVNGFQIPCMLVLTSLVLIVWHILAVSPLWLLIICAWPLFMLLCLALEWAAARIIPKP